MMGIDPKSTALAMAIAKLHRADAQGQFHPMKLGGILCLVVDRSLHSRFLRLYDINTNELLFQSELYFNFHETYREINDYFYTFPLQKLNIGIQFANVHDASTFKNLIQTYSFKGESADQVAKDHKLKLGNQTLDITKPLAFERKEHAGWDPTTQTFILNEVPKEIKMLLKKAGFKKKDLKKKETALAIYEILLRELEFDSSTTKSIVGLKTGGRTSSDLNTKGFLSNRMSNEETRMNNERTGSVMNFGLTTQPNYYGHNTLQNQDYLDPKGNKGMLMSNQLLNSAARISNIGKSPGGFSPDVKGEEHKQMKPPPIPPPLMGSIPPPPMGIPPPTLNIMAPPPMMGKIQPPPTSQSQNPNLSFNDMLIQQSKNLKKVQENQINTKVKNLSESQQMKLTMNLAVVLEQRKKALQNEENKKGGDSEEESDQESVGSDDSAW